MALFKNTKLNHLIKKILKTEQSDDRVPQEPRPDISSIKLRPVVTDDYIMQLVLTETWRCGGVVTANRRDDGSVEIITPEKIITIDLYGRRKENFR